MRLLGVDVGTTHCKAGLVAPDGALHRLASRPTESQRTAEGHFWYEPDALWQSVAAAITEAVGDEGAQVAAVGIASMAETGLLVGAADGAPRTRFIPWFDRRAEAQAQRVARASEARERFVSTGLPASFKYALPKLLWLREQDARVLEGAVWLSAADWVALRLTGRMATDPTLAARTDGFDVPGQQWDASWLQRWGLAPELFPAVCASGQPMGAVHSEGLGLARGTPVAIAGHDHLCAALAVGAAGPGVVFDSMGTAETLIGAVASWETVRAAGPESGLAFGRHVAPGQWFWLGGLPASGGSVEWLRAILGEPPLPYEALRALLDERGEEPTGIFYLPYLAGSGAPEPDPSARGAFVGLTAAHGRAALLRAVLEGTAFEMEAIRRRAEQVTGAPIQRIVAAGGGTRNRAWLRIKADVSGVPIEVADVAEAAVLGAALLAGIGAGVVDSAELAPPRTQETVVPDPTRHQQYRQRYEEGYVPLRRAIRGFTDGG